MEKAQESTSLLPKSSGHKGYSSPEIAGEPLRDIQSQSQNSPDHSNAQSSSDQSKAKSGSGSFKSPSYERIITKSYAEFDADHKTTRSSHQRCLSTFLALFVAATVVLSVIVALYATGYFSRPERTIRPTAIIQTQALPPILATVSDYEEYAKLHLDRNAWLYFSTGATQEVTLRDNVEAYTRLRILPKRQQDVSLVESSLSVDTFGGKISLPIGISPTAFHMWATKEGENATVRAAKAINTVMIVSIDSSIITEQLAKTQPDTILWQQTYIFGDVNETLYMVKKAEKSNCKAIVLTIDKAAETLRYPMMRGEMAYSPGIPYMINYPYSGNLIPGTGYYKKRSWDDIAWFVKQTKLPVIVKGVLTADEAKMAVEKGASGIIVSNHGGRALDGVPATIDQLAEVVAAVKGQVPVYVDGGIRTGMDVFKALALGAKMVFVGRPTLWGLAHSGQAGLEAVFNILKTELVNTMQMAGTGNLTLLTKDYVYNANNRYCSKI